MNNVKVYGKLNYWERSGIIQLCKMSEQRHCNTSCPFCQIEIGTRHYDVKGNRITVKCGQEDLIFFEQTE